MHLSLSLSVVCFAMNRAGGTALKNGDTIAQMKDRDKAKAAEQAVKKA